MTTGRVLVTGAAGFIGRHVARHYSRAGWVVTGIGHGSWSQDEWQQWGINTWIRADITVESLRTNSDRPDIIVHCAGGGSVGHSINHPFLDFQETVDTTAAVLEYARLEAPGVRLVYPSSGGVYGDEAALPIVETSPLKPHSPYASHKLMAEQLCASYAANFGLAVSIVRLFSVYGPGLRKQLLWDACQKILTGQHEYFGTGDESRDWLHVNDAAKLLMAAAEHADASCPVTNGGTGEAATVREILHELYCALDVAGAPCFVGALRLGDPAHFKADISRSIAWGWQPQVKWQEGVREYAAWFRRGVA